jgi:hypothetical protein
LIKFLKSQKGIEEFKGLYANKEEGDLARDVNRALNKIKRAVCDVARVEGKDIKILWAPASKVVWNKEGRVLEVAYVDGFGNINWSESVENDIRKHTENFLNI